LCKVGVGTIKAGKGTFAMKQQTTTESSPRPLGQSPTAEVDTATLELLAKWRREDATKNPEELRAAEQELSEFKRALNENRTEAGEPALYP
jgi:hypothetical protein